MIPVVTAAVETSVEPALGNPPAAQNPALREDAPPAAFSCRGIVKRYRGAAVVEDINLDIPSGEILSLLGPSGVGKTTLFNVLSGVDSLDEGRVFLNGKDITGVSGRVSYMMQKDLLLEYRTVLDNVILPLLVRGLKKNKARKQGAVFFERFGLSGYETFYPRQLSGGMRQRAALLRTCLQARSREEAVILLDEPFSALDALTRRSMHIWFQEIARAMNFTALFITHDVEEALILSGRVCVLKGKPGRLSDFFEVKAPYPRGDDFSVSPEFAGLKRELLAAIKG